MKTKLQPKTAFSVQVLTRNQNVYVHVKIPKRWLNLLAVILGAILTSTPLTQLIEVLTPILK